MSKLTFKEAAAADTPASGYIVFYAKTDGLLYFKDDAGTEFPVKPTGGGTGDLLADGTVPLTGSWPVGGNDITAIGVLTLTEQAAAETDVAGQGQIWVKTATPNELWFTDDAGTDTQLGVGGGGGMTPQFKSAAYTAVNGDIVYVDTSGGAVTIDLPITPNTGDLVFIKDSGGVARTDNITVDRNGETIDGVAADFIIDLNYGQSDFAYDGTTWKIAPINGVS